MRCVRRVQASKCPHEIAAPNAAGFTFVPVSATATHRPSIDTFPASMAASAATPAWFGYQPELGECYAHRLPHPFICNQGDAAQPWGVG